MARTLVAIPAGTERVKCKSCPMWIYFVPNAKTGRHMPLHVLPGEPTHVHPTAAADGAGEPHWGACKDAAAHRKRSDAGHGPL